MNADTSIGQSKTVHNILVVEDDASLAEWVGDYLVDNGYLVTVANTGTAAIELVEADQPDLVILDVNLPGQDGFTVCRTIRAFYSKPVLMLTARGEEEDEVLGLECGANDYLVKPVRPKALLARLQSLLRPDTAGSRMTRCYGNITIDADNRSVLLDNESIHLSSNEFDLLWLLAEHAGNIMPREDIVTHLRGIEYDGFDRSVDILISRLRKKLKDNSAQPYRIKTVRGKGYLFTLDGWS